MFSVHFLHSSSVPFFPRKWFWKKSMYHHCFGSTCTMNGCFSYHVISLMPPELPGMTYPSPSMTLFNQRNHQMTYSFFPRFWRQWLVLAPFSSCLINCKPLSPSFLFSPSLYGTIACSCGESPTQWFKTSRFALGQISLKQHQPQRVCKGRHLPCPSIILE